MQFQWGSKKVDPCHAQYNSKADPLKMILLRGSEPEGLQDPALSAPAVLRRRGNRIHRSKTATQQDHYHQRELGKYLPHLTVWWSPPFKKFSPRFPLEKCQRNTFPTGVLAVISQNIYSLHTPARGILSTDPLHLPPTAGATADGLVTLDHVSLQEFCPALSKQSQGHYSS